MENSAELLTRAAEALAAWDDHYDARKELEMARELHFRAGSSRPLLVEPPHICAFTL